MAASGKKPSKAGKASKIAARKGEKTGSRRVRPGERGLPRNLREICGL